MKLGWFYIKNALFTISCFATGCFYNKCKRIALIHEPELAFWFFYGAGIHEYSSFDQVAVNIGYHAANITLGIRAAIRLIFFLAEINILLHAFSITEKIAVIDRIYRSRWRTFYIRMA